MYKRNETFLLIFALQYCKGKKIPYTILLHTFQAHLLVNIIEQQQY